MPSATRASLSPDPNDRVEVLQVRQLWGDVVLDARHFRPSAGRVRVGDKLGWRWELLGVDMGFVPEPLHKVLPWLPPIWSEVHMAAKDDFCVEEEVLPSLEGHDLFRYDPDLGWLIRPPGQEAEPVGTEPIDLPMGDTRFEVRVVSAARRTERPLWSMDRTLAGTLGMMAGLGMCFGILVASAPPPTEVTLLEDDNPYFEAMMRIPPKPPEQKKPEPVVEKQPEPEEAVASNGRNRLRDPEPLERGGNRGLKNRELEEARSAGIFAGGGLEELMGADSALSPVLVAATGRMVAKGNGGAGIGVNGLGDRRGGLGDGGGIDGMGSVDIWGDGGPPGVGDNPWGDGEGKQTGQLADVGGTPVLIGGLSRDQVDRVVKNHLSAIRYCYQRELTKTPSLGGKLSIKFTIASDGTVSGANARVNSLGSQAVEQCVVGRFFKMQFPEPSGGGIALVTYPFVFAPG